MNLNSTRKKAAVLVEGYLQVDSSLSFDLVAPTQSTRRNEGGWQRYYCVLEKSLMCMYLESPWISSSEQPVQFFIPITFNSTCRLAATKPGHKYEDKHIIELSSSLSGTYGLHAPSVEKGNVWMKALNSDVKAAREAAANLTFPFGGWVKIASMNRQYGDNHAQYKDLPLTSGYGILEENCLYVYAFPRTHYTEVQQTPRRIVHISSTSELKLYAREEDDSDYLFSVDTESERIILSLGSEFERQLWLNSCGLLILKCKYPKFEMEALMLTQYLQSMGMEQFAQTIVEAGFSSIQSLSTCSPEDLDSVINKIGLNPVQKDLFKAEVNALRPNVVVKQSIVLRRSKMTRAELQKERERKKVSIKEAYLASKVISRYPLSVANQKTNKKKKALLYSWGNADHLGIRLDYANQASRKVLEPTPVTSLRSRNAPDSLFAGDGFTACITKNGKLFAWGNGPLGTSNEVFDMKLTPHPVRGLPNNNITYVSCGVTHMACVTQLGDLYSWGEGPRGELGLGEDCLETAKPLLVPKVGSLYEDEVVAVCCAPRHTLVLTNDGFVFAMGEAANGKLGNENHSGNVYEPEWVDVLDASVVAQIAATETFSVAVSLNGEAFIWGRVTKDSEILPPMKMESFDDRMIRQVESNNYIVGFLVGTFADSNVPSVYTLGEMPIDSLNFLLGHEAKHGEVKPRRIENLEGHKVVDISFSKTHCSALCLDGRILLWGTGDQGQLGIGQAVNVATPHEAYYVEGYSYRRIVCGTGYTSAILEENDEDNSAAGTTGQVIVPNNPARIEAHRQSVSLEKLKEESQSLMSGLKYQLRRQGTSTSVMS